MNRCPKILFLTLSYICSPAPSQTLFFNFEATVTSPAPHQVSYSLRVGALQGRALDPYLRGSSGPFGLYVYHVPDIAGNDLYRLGPQHFTRTPLSSGQGTFSVPAHNGLTYCIFSLEAFPEAWGIAGVYNTGARVPSIQANAPTHKGIIGGAYTSVDNPVPVHNLINSVILPLPRSLAVQIMNGQTALVLRDPVSGQSRFMQTDVWTQWLDTNNGRRVTKEVVGYFQNGKPGAFAPYYEQLEVHAVPASQVAPPVFQLQPELQRPISIAIDASPAQGTGRYVFHCELARPDELLIDGPLVKVLRFKGALQPIGNINNPIPAANCPVVNVIAELYSGETFINVKAMLTNSRFEGSGHFVFDEIRLTIPGASIHTHNYQPYGATYKIYRPDLAGTDSIALVPSLGGGRHNRLRESGTFLWNAGTFADFGTPSPRLQMAADNLRLYLTQFFGNRNLPINYFDQPFNRGAGIPDLRYQGMMEDWKTSWQRPSGINNNAQNAFSIYAHRTQVFRSDGSSPYLFPYPCFGPRSGGESGVDEGIMPHNGAIVLAYNANSVTMVDAIETALLMGRGTLTRQPIDTMFLGDGTPNTLDYMRYRMWDAPTSQRIREARMFAGIYFYNSGNGTRSAFHPNLDYQQTAAYQAHIAEGNVPYNELLSPHDTQHCQRYTTHAMESLYKTNPCFLGKIYMDAASEMMCSLSHYTGESPTRQYNHISYGTSLWNSLNAPPGTGNGGRSFEAFGLHAEAMFHRPLRQSDVIIGQQMAAIVQRVARSNGYMGSLFGQDARHFEPVQEAGLRSQVSQHLTQVLQRAVGPNDFSLVGVDLRWQADVWNMIFGSVAKAYEGSALDAEARIVMQALDRDMVATYTDHFDGAFSSFNRARIHVGLEHVRLDQEIFQVPNAIKNGQYANMSGGPYEKWVFGLYADCPNWRAHLAATSRLPAGLRGNNRDLILPVSPVGQESVNGAGIQALWAFQQLGL